MQDIAAFRRRGSVTVQSLTGQAADGDVLSGGPQVAQWVVAQLFSRRGSTPFRETEGTTLADDLTGGRLVTDADVYAAFSAAAARVLATASGLETSTTPLGERVRAIALKGLTVAPGAVTFSVAVQTRAARTTYRLNVTFDLTLP